MRVVVRRGLARRGVNRALAKTCMHVSHVFVFIFNTICVSLSSLVKSFVLSMSINTLKNTMRSTPK